MGTASFRTLTVTAWTVATSSTRPAMAPAIDSRSRKLRASTISWQIPHEWPVIGRVGQVVRGSGSAQVLVDDQVYLQHLGHRSLVFTHTVAPFQTQALEQDRVRTDGHGSVSWSRGRHPRMMASDMHATRQFARTS